MPPYSRSGSWIFYKEKTTALKQWFLLYIEFLERKLNELYFSSMVVLATWLGPSKRLMV